MFSPLGSKAPEMLAILNVGINVNNCTTNIDNAQPLDNKAAIRLKFPKVLEGLGKLKGIPFSKRQQTTAKLK